MVFTTDGDIMMRVSKIQEWVSQSKHGNVRTDCPPGCCYDKIHLLAVKYLHGPRRIQAWTKCFKADWFDVEKKKTLWRSCFRPKSIGCLFFHSQLWFLMQGTGQDLVFRHWNNPASKSKGINGSDITLSLLMGACLHPSRRMRLWLADRWIKTLWHPIVYQQGRNKIDAQIGLGSLNAEAVFNWAVGKRRPPYFWQGLKKALQILGNHWYLAGEKLRKMNCCCTKEGPFTASGVQHAASKERTKRGKESVWVRCMTS